MNIALTNRDLIELLDVELASHPGRCDLEVKHYFSDGIYTRELYIPKGVALTGKIHKTSCINILAKGKMRVISDTGEYDIEAPYTFVSAPLIRKAGYALEDSVWINVHPWDGSSTIEQIEELVTVSNSNLLCSEAKWAGLLQQQ